MENDNNPNTLTATDAIDMRDLLAHVEPGKPHPFAEETVVVAGQDVQVGVGPIAHDTEWVGDRRVLFGVTVAAHGKSVVVCSLDRPAAYIATGTEAESDEWSRERAVLQQLASQTGSADGLVGPLPAAEASGDVLYEQGAPGRNMLDIMKALHVAGSTFPGSRGWLSEEFISYVLRDMRDSAIASLSQIHQAGGNSGQIIEYGHAHPGNFIFNWRTAQIMLCDYTHASVTEGLDADRAAAADRDTRRFASEWRMSLAEEGLDAAVYKKPDAGGLSHEQAMAKLEATLIRVDLSRIGVEITDAEVESVAAMIHTAGDRLAADMPAIRYPQAASAGI